MQIKTIEDATVAALPPRIDAFVAKDIEAELVEAVEGGAQKLVCDLGNTEYISSGGLRTLMVVDKALKKAEGRLVLCGLQSFVREVLDVACVLPLFEVCDTQEEALAMLKGDA